MDNNTLILLGKNIRIYRKRRGMTLDQLAEKIYKTKSNVSKYERGLVAIDVATLMDICGALGISPRVLLPVNQNETTYTPVAIKTPGKKEYLYVSDGRKDLVRALMVYGRPIGDKVPINLFYGLVSFDNPHKCRALYYGSMTREDDTVTYLMRNQRNKIEYATICTKNPLNYSGQKVGMLTGISARSLMPAAAKCILSETELPENEKLKEALKLSREDIRLTKKYNMFTLDQLDF